MTKTYKLILKAVNEDSVKDFWGIDELTDDDMDDIIADIVSQYNIDQQSIGSGLEITAFSAMEEESTNE